MNVERAAFAFTAFVSFLCGMLCGFVASILVGGAPP